MAENRERGHCLLREQFSVMSQWSPERVRTSCDKIRKCGPPGTFSLQIGKEFQSAVEEGDQYLSVSLSLCFSVSPSPCLSVSLPLCLTTSLSLSALSGHGRPSLFSCFPDQPNSDHKSSCPPPTHRTEKLSSALYPLYVSREGQPSYTDRVYSHLFPFVAS